MPRRSAGVPAAGMPCPACARSVPSWTKTCFASRLKAAWTSPAGAVRGSVRAETEPFDAFHTVTTRSGPRKGPTTESSQRESEDQARLGVAAPDPSGFRRSLPGPGVLEPQPARPDACHRVAVGCGEGDRVPLVGRAGLLAQGELSAGTGDVPGLDEPRASGGEQSAVVVGEGQRIGPRGEPMETVSGAVVPDRGGAVLGRCRDEPAVVGVGDLEDRCRVTDQGRSSPLQRPRVVPDHPVAGSNDQGRAVGAEGSGADAVRRDEPVPTRGEEAAGVHVVRADGWVAPCDDVEPVAAWAQREVGELRQDDAEDRLRRVCRVPDHHPTESCELPAGQEPMELGGEPLPIAAEGHVDVVPRRVEDPPALREAARLPRRQRPARHVVEPQVAVGGSGHGQLVAGGRERDRGALRSVVGERQAPERGGVEQLGTARPEATDEQRPVRAGGQGRDVRGARSPQFPAQVMNTRQGARPRQCRSEVLPGLGRVVGLDALYREEQTGSEVLVQHALSAGAAGVREVGCLLRTVPLTVGQVSLARGPVGRPDGDQPGGHRQDQQDDDTRRASHATAG